MTRGIPLRLFAALVLLALALPISGAAAQGGTERLQLELEPSAGEAAPGGVVEVALVVTSEFSRTVAARVEVVRPDAFPATLEGWEFVLAPGASTRLHSRIDVPPGTAPGAYQVTYRIEETPESAGDAPPATVTARLPLRVVAPPRGSAPQLTVEPVELLVAPGGGALMRVRLRAGDAPLVEPRLELALPPGVAARVGSLPVEIGPGQSAEAQVMVSAAADLQEGAVFPGNVRLRDAPDAMATFRVRIGHAAAPAPPPLAEDGLAVGGALVLAAGGAIGAFAFLRRKWPLLLGPLYSRVRPNRVLENPVRARFAALVRETPGLTFGDVQRRLGLGAGSVTHHARMLEKAGVVFSTTDGRERRFFHVGAGRVERVPPLAERALLALRERPRSGSDLARELGVSRQALHYHLRHLQANGRVLAREAGRDVVYSATGALPEA